MKDDCIAIGAPELLTCCYDSWANYHQMCKLMGGAAKTNCERCADQNLAKCREDQLGESIGIEDLRF